MSQFSNIILSVAGTALTADEVSLFRAIKPQGIILFTRNIESGLQIKQLTAALREIIGEELLILVDQEGGRIGRINFGFALDMKAPEFFAKMAMQNLAEAKVLIRAQYLLCAMQLRDLGINVNCAPLADVRYDFAHDVIGDRSFGDDLHIIHSLCTEVDKGLAAGGVQSVLKHIPGHGRAQADSHVELPTVNAQLEELESTDFAVFKGLRSIKMAMTAHVKYTALDGEGPATTSAVVIDYIRKQLNYSGILMTDALEMQALQGDIAANFERSVAAGCDLGLYCHGEFAVMSSMAEKAQSINGDLRAKIAALNCNVNVNNKLEEYGEQLAQEFYKKSQQK